MCKIISIIFGLIASVITCTIYIHVYVALLIYNVTKFITHIIFYIVFKKKSAIQPYGLVGLDYGAGVFKWLKFFTWYKPCYSAHHTNQIIFRKKSREEFLIKLGFGTSWLFVVANLILILTFGFGKIYFEYAYIFYRRFYNSIYSLHNEKTTTFKLQFKSLLILEIQSLKKLKLEVVTIPDDL